MQTVRGCYIGQIEGKNVAKTVKAADVLIVEDSEEAIWMMGNVLQKEGLMVKTTITEKG